MPIIESRNDDARPDEPKARAVVTPEMALHKYRAKQGSSYSDSPDLRKSHDDVVV